MIEQEVMFQILDLYDDRITKPIPFNQIYLDFIYISFGKLR